MEEVSSWFVVLMGIGTVFIGLICIILICSLLGFLLKGHPKSQAVKQETPVENQQELIAVMAAGIAAHAKTDPACIRILSVRKVK